ncbi:MAG: argininosuccinate lyase [Rhodothermales bacterium]
MLWQKDTRVEDWVTRFTVGEDNRWDTLLLPYDITATRAHAWGLSQIDILSDADLDRIESVLEALEQAVREGTVVVTLQDEDGHTVIEQFLTEHLGDLGKKIHTGRSRNDQVLAAVRLFLRDHLQQIARQTAELATMLCGMGEQGDGLLMPGYTHLQRAMPSTAGLWAMGYAELLTGDLEGLRQAHDHINVSPLGSAAGYGVPYLPLPRRAVAEKLGFRDVQTHVTAVQLSRGKLELHIVHALVQVAATINRMASDLVLFNTSEFGFVTLPAEYCTGSSIMPQKQNPDVLELARATYHRLLAEMQVLLTLPANLPSGYHRDLQLTKEAGMRSVGLTRDLLTAMLHLLPGVRFEKTAMEQASTQEVFATAYALDRVQAGVPFREAYREAALHVEKIDRPDPETALAAYSVDGYPGRVRPDLVRQALARHREWLPLE